MHLLDIFKVAHFSFRFIKVQDKINEHFIDEFLDPFYKKYKKKFKESTINKIKKNYCIALPLTSAAYLKIYGKKISYKEIEYAILMGILVPLIDDFTDDKTLNSKAIDTFTSSPTDYEPKTLEEDVAKTIMCYLLENVKCADGFLYSAKQTMQAQHWSQRQMEPGVFRDELQSITLEKGGWSMILFHYIIDEVPSQQTIDILYIMGGMGQMCNDIFDVYKDHKEGIATYANTCNDYKILEKYYTIECRKFVATARAMPYKKQDIEFFISFFVMVLSRGIVALHMLYKLQKQLGGGVLPIAQLDRKQLICDMEKPINIFKMIWYAYKIKSK